MEGRGTGQDTWRSRVRCFGQLSARLPMLLVKNAPLMAWMLWARTGGKLPRGVRLRLAGLLGEAAYWVMPAHQRATLRNVWAVRTREHVGRQIKASRDVDRRIARESWRNYGRVLADIVDLVTVRSAGINDLVSSVDGWENIERGLSSGRGLIIACAHVGNWEVAGTVLASRYPVLAIADAIPPDALNRIISDSRSTRGIRTAPPTLAGLREVRRVLSRGGIVVILVDRPRSHRDASGFSEVTFMGLRTWIPNGVSRFAIASGAPVVAAGAVMDANSRYRVTASPPMHFGGGATVESVMSTVLGALEPLIAEYPSQWFMFRDMWPCEKPSRLEDTTRSQLLFGLRSATTSTVPSPQEIILQAGFTIGSLLPREALEEITGIAGMVAYSVPNNRSVGLSHNLAIVLGQTIDHASVRNSVRASVGLHFENYADLLRGSRIGREEIEARSEILGPGWDVVKASIGRGTGAILISAHFGRVELLGHVLENLDIPVTLMVERLRPSRLHELVSRNRKRDRFSILTPDVGARPVWRALDRGDLLVSFTDWVPPVAPVPATSSTSPIASGNRSFAVRISGREVHFPALPYRIAALRRLPLLFGYGLALPLGRVRAVIEAQCAGNDPGFETPISVRPQSGYVRWTGTDEDAPRAAHEVANRLGDLLRRHPDQWTLGHRVFDTP